MSAQTGSQGLVDRARSQLRRWESQPNPLWVRELRQSARLARTPVIVTVVAVLVILLIAALGGVVSSEASPAATGVILFQAFFSIAYFVVTLLGPAVAASSIASEREGRTWEAVVLTGLSPAAIARGKFLAAFTAIATYIVMLAPVGALPFLFGGVTATEVVIAFGVLLLVALLSVAFGLAISSKTASLRAAIVVTLLLAFLLSVVAFLSLGVSLSYVAHHAWPGVADGPPIWLPTAYERAPLDAHYLIFLVALPVLAVALPAWFLYEVTVTNLGSLTDDRSSGLKRWFLVAAPALTVVAGIPAATVAASDRVAAWVAALGGLSAFFLFCVFLFAGDPIGPSRRVVIHWDRAGVGALRRFLGPGVMRSAMLVLAVGGVALASLSAFGVAVASSAAGSRSTDVASVLGFAGYALAFHVFAVGLGAFLRARAPEPLVARVLLFGVLFGVTVGPWIVAAIGGILGDHAALDRDMLAVAAPSPLYVFVMVDMVGGHGSGFLVRAGVAAIIGWALLGVVLLGAAARRCRRILRRNEALMAEGDRVLAADDEAAAAARATAPADMPPAEPAAADAP
jgi:ABC-type transport system involved in multi-copper enzyme maturation permease subunit